LVIRRFSYAKTEDSQAVLMRHCALKMAVDSSAKQVQKIFIVLAAQAQLTC
jgi:hypothetical protein